MLKRGVERGRLMLRNVVLTFVEGPRLGLSLSHREECR